MSGTLYGVGVGPGNPENLTYLAVKTINAADIIAVPKENKKDSIAYKIAAGAYGSIDSKNFIEVDMPMTKDKEVLKNSYIAAADLIAKELDAGKSVAFLNLGDPCIYGTYIYIHKEVASRGYDTKIINGIPSFCAVAARLNDSISEKDEMVHIVPSSYDIHDALRMPGTKILMKAGRQMKTVKEAIKAYMAKTNKKVSAQMVDNCPLENERVYEGPDNIPEDSSYFSIIMVRESNQ